MHYGRTNNTASKYISTHRWDRFGWVDGNRGNDLPYAVYRGRPGEWAGDSRRQQVGRQRQPAPKRGCVHLLKPEKRGDQRQNHFGVTCSARRRVQVIDNTLPVSLSHTEDTVDSFLVLRANRCPTTTRTIAVHTPPSIHIPGPCMSRRCSQVRMVMSSELGQVRIFADLLSLRLWLYYSPPLSPFSRRFSLSHHRTNRLS